jgi:hypothetical protein
MAEHFKLADGRVLDFHTSGAPDGFPLVFIHGTPGAYPVFPSFITACEQRNIKLVAFQEQDGAVQAGIKEDVLLISFRMCRLSLIIWG